MVIACRGAGGMAPNHSVWICAAIVATVDVYLDEEFEETRVLCIMEVGCVGEWVTVAQCVST